MTNMPDPLDFLYPPVAPRKPGRGVILVAEPMMYDHYFSRSIVLLTEHNEEGSVGFVLNNVASRQTSIAVEKATDIHATIGIGGPVEPQMLCFLHTAGKVIPEAVHIVGNIYSGGDFNIAKQLLDEGILDYSQFRFFLGYSGWSVGQLEDEIAIHSWAIADFPPEQLFVPNKELWTDVVKSLGPAYRAWLHTPANPLFN